MCNVWKLGLKINKNRTDVLPVSTIAIFFSPSIPATADTAVDDKETQVATDSP